MCGCGEVEWGCSVWGGVSVYVEGGGVGYCS